MALVFAVETEELGTTCDNDSVTCGNVTIGAHPRSMALLIAMR